MSKKQSSESHQFGNPNTDTLRQQLMHLEEMYRSAPIGLGFVDTNLCFVGANAELLRIVGNSSEHHVGRRIANVLSSAAGELEPLLKRVLESGESAIQEMRSVKPDDQHGEQRHVVSAHPVRDDAGQVVGVNLVVQDTTELSRVEEQYRVRVKQQALVAALGAMALVQFDIQDLIEEAVARVAEALAVPLVELLQLSSDGQTLLLTAGVGWRGGVVGTAGVSSGPDSQAGFTLIANEPVVVEDLSHEKRFKVPNLLAEHGVVSGMTVVVAGEPKPFGVLGVHTTEPREFTAEDVNLLRAVANVLAAAVKDRKSEQALRDSESRKKAILNTLVDGIISIDDRGVIDALNPAAERLFGYEAAELLNQNVSTLMPQPYRGEHDRYIANYLATGHAKIIGIGREVVGQRKDGTIFPMELAVSEMRVGGRRMFTGVVRDITERRRLEREIVEAGAEEQRRIGRDLHDGLCQHLAGIAFAAEVLTQKLAARKAPETQNIAKIAELVDQAITQARDLAHGLQPVSADANGLVMALESLTKKIESLFHVVCMFVCDKKCKIHDTAMATHLYRIAQEAISNALRHGKARTIVVELAVSGDELQLHIRDDGTGFVQPEPHNAGIGLKSMQYRARIIGGNVMIRAGERSGTVVSCVLRSSNVEGGGTEKSSTTMSARRKGSRTHPPEGENSL